VNQRIIFLRGGGLGDFILTLPLLKLAWQKNHEVTLYTLSKYLTLLNNDWDWLDTHDLDQLNGVLPSHLAGAMVVCFWMDQAWQKEMINAGAKSVVSINPRPSEGEHFLLQACEKLGLPFSKNFLDQPVLCSKRKPNKEVLWIHPGSGGKEKNIPLQHFIHRAHKWLAADEFRRVIFSFGEADNEVLEHFSGSPINQNNKISRIHVSSISELYKKLSTEADYFMGNDSGPGHLAAALGLPVEIGFCSTNPVIWRPAGPRVKTYKWESDSSNIL